MFAHEITYEHRHAQDPSDDACLRVLPCLTDETPHGQAERWRYQRAVNTDSVSAAFLVRPAYVEDEQIRWERAEAAQPLVAAINEAIQQHPRQLRFRWLKAHLVGRIPDSDPEGTPERESIEQIAERCKTTPENTQRGLNSAAREVCSRGIVRRWVEDRVAVSETPLSCGCRRASRGEDCGHQTDRVSTEGGRTPNYWRWRTHVARERQMTA